MDSLCLICKAVNDAQYEHESKTYYLCKRCLNETRLDDTKNALLEQEQLENNPLRTYETNAKNYEEILPFITYEERIENDKLTTLLPGDHIMWRRPYVICHHAIVVQQPNENEDIEVIHWSGTKHTFPIVEICRETKKFSSQWGTLYRINYNRDIAEKNPNDLALKRAEAVLGLQDYKFFTRNCENIARFCKTSVNFNSQFPWLKRKLAQIARSVFFKAYTAIILDSMTVHLWGFDLIMNFGYWYEFFWVFCFLIMEIASLFTDLIQMFLQYKYSTVHYNYLSTEYTQAAFVTVLEYIVGFLAMIFGVAFGAVLFKFMGLPMLPVGDSGSTIVNLATLVLVTSVCGGIAGVLAKLVGNVAGAYIRSKWHPKSEPTIVRVENTAAAAESREMISRCRSYWGMVPYTVMFITVCCLILAFSFSQYLAYSESTETICVAKEVFYFEGYFERKFPCPGIMVFVMDEQSAEDSAAHAAHAKLLVHMATTMEEIGSKNASHYPELFESFKTTLEGMVKNLDTLVQAKLFISRLSGESHSYGHYYEGLAKMLITVKQTNLFSLARITSPQGSHNTTEMLKALAFYLEHHFILDQLAISQMFEDAHAMLKRLCSFYPQSTTDETARQSEMDNYLKKYVDGYRFKCYYYPQDPKRVTRQPIKLSWQLFISAHPSSIIVGTISLVCLVCIICHDRHHAKRDENWIFTILVLSGLTSYWHFFVTLRCGRLPGLVEDVQEKSLEKYKAQKPWQETNENRKRRRRQRRRNVW